MEITPVAASPVEYDYTGSDFTSITCVVGTCTGATTPTTVDSISGDIVIDGGLPASSADFDPTITSFSFTDGVNTISSVDPNATISTSFFQTDATGSIQNFAIFPTLTEGTFSTGNLNLSMSISSVTGDSSSHLSFDPFDSNPVSSTAATPLPGMWSSPCSADLKGTVHPSTGTAKSKTGDPYTISATFDPAVGLMQAETDCNVSGFDWQQTISPTALVV
jgi:hypothetical protein